MTTDSDLTEQIIRESSQFLAPTEQGYWAPTETQTRAAIARALEIVSNHIYYEGRKQLGADDDQLWQMRASNADGWLDSIALDLVPGGTILPTNEETQ